MPLAFPEPAELFSPPMGLPARYSDYNRVRFLACFYNGCMSSSIHFKVLKQKLLSLNSGVSVDEAAEKLESSLPAKSFITAHVCADIDRTVRALYRHETLYSLNPALEIQL